MRLLVVLMACNLLSACSDFDAGYLKCVQDNRCGVGRSCRDAGECEGPGSTPMCLGSLGEGLLTMPGGYCSLSCAADSECGAEAVCLKGNQGKAACFKQCETRAACRGGYVCQFFGSDVKVCVGACDGGCLGAARCINSVCAGATKFGCMPDGGATGCT